MLTQTFRRIRAKAARSSIRVPYVWSWHLGLKPQDVFLASYPRSGSTWLRFMLFEIMCGEDPGFRKIESRLPEIQWHRGVPAIFPNGGRLIKTHEKYRKEYTRAVFLIRDARDVLLSAYAGFDSIGLTRLVSKGDLDSFLTSFLEGKALQMGSWQEHSRSWLESPLAKNGNLMVIRYEDLRKNPEPMLGELLEFVGLKPNFQVIRKAIEDNTLQRMRAKEDRAKSRRAVDPAGQAQEHRGRKSLRPHRIRRWVARQATPDQVKLVEQYAGETLRRSAMSS